MPWLVAAGVYVLLPALVNATAFRPRYSHIVLAYFLLRYRRVTLPLLRIVIVFVVLHLNLSQARHAPIFLAQPLAEQFTRLAASRM